MKVSKTSIGIEEVMWQRGDKTIFDEVGDIKSGELVISASTSLATVPTSTKASYEAFVFFHLLHVLLDKRMAITSSKLLEPRTRAELDTKPTYPCNDSIAPLFSDETFRHMPIQSLAGRITRSDMGSMNPDGRPHEREGYALKRKFREFKSLYGTSVSR